MRNTSAYEVRNTSAYEVRTIVRMFGRASLYL